MPATGGVSLLYRHGLSGGAPTLVSPSSYSQFQPDWSPRGDWIAFISDSAGGNNDLYVASTTGSELRLLKDGIYRQASPSFSPNGQQVAYVNQVRVAQPGGGFAYKWEIRRINLDGTGDVALLTSGPVEPSSLRWSPDASQILFLRSDSLYAIRLDDGLVLSRMDLVPTMSSFDLHRGTGPILIEQPGTVVWASSCQDNGNPGFSCCIDSSCTRNLIDFRRIALRDTLTGDTQARFYRTGAEYFHPRWSFDGTRIAYATDQNHPGTDRDIYVGQVSYDHPPVFTDFNDRGGVAGFPVDIEFHAADPDGETVTYETVSRYLPTGMGFSGGSSAHFTWSTAVEGAYWLVVRAKDGSGGLDNRVLKLTITGGGCPFVDTRTAAGWQVENSILGRSLSGSLALDDYRIKLTPDGGDGRIRLRIRENEQEETSLDQVRLIAVDHDPALRAYSIGERVVLGTRIPAQRVTTATGSDLTALVDGNGDGFVANPGDTLLVELTGSTPNGALGSQSTQPGGEGGFDDGGGGKDGGGGMRSADISSSQAADAEVLASTGIRIQAPDGSGGWRTVRTRYPRAYYDECLTDSLWQGTVRLAFVGRHRVGFLGRVMYSPDSLPARKLSLLSAQHSRLGDVSTAVDGLGNLTTGLTPGDTVNLDFAWPPVPEGKVRELFLLSRGVYTANLPASQHAELPAQFRLLQNIPNPFSNTTSIGFDLPRPARVRVEIYDLQGRLVRRLVDRGYEAGRWNEQWDRRDGGGAPVRAGVYLYRINAGALTDQKKMVLLD